MTWPWEAASDVNPWWPETKYMIGWPLAHTCEAHCPYCFIHEGMTKRAADGARWWSDDQAVAAWRRVADEHGPCHIVFSGLEPSEQLVLISRVLEFHRGAMLTNLTFDIAEFSRLIPPCGCAFTRPSIPMPGGLV